MTNLTRFLIVATLRARHLSCFPANACTRLDTAAFSFSVYHPLRRTSALEIVSVPQDPGDRYWYCQRHNKDSNHRREAPFFRLNSGCLPEGLGRSFAALEFLWRLRAQLPLQFVHCVLRVLQSHAGVFSIQLNRLNLPLGKDCISDVFQLWLWNRRAQIRRLRSTVWGCMSRLIPDPL